MPVRAAQPKEPRESIRRKETRHRPAQTSEESVDTPWPRLSVCIPNRSPWPRSRQHPPARANGSPRAADPASPPIRGASRDPLHPLAPPGRRREGVCEVLCLMHHLPVAELHKAHGVGKPPPGR